MKHHEQLPEHIKSGQAGGDKAHEPEYVISVAESLPQNEILGEESGGKWRSGNRQRGNDVGPIRYRHVRLEATHFTHVLLAAQSMDDAAGAEKQTGFEKRMGKDMKESGAECSYTYGEKHVAQLTDR